MIETPFNFTGSKYKLLDQILPEFDYTKDNFVDVFCGGGSVYTNIVDKYSQIVVNDVISDLIGIHKGLITDDEIIEKTKSICPIKGNPEEFAKLRQEYNNNSTPEGLWALMLSSTNNMMRFNQKFKYNQTYGDRGWNKNTDVKVENFINHIRKFSNKIHFTSNTFYNLEIKPDSMYYLDPPYGRVKNSDGTIGKKQISEAGYNAFWKEDDDIKLYEFIKKINDIGSSFMVSGVLKHNDMTCWMLDKLINDGFSHKVLKYDYNKVSRKGNKETVEVIIKNY
jgi:DNA adenine methylase Dam